MAETRSDRRPLSPHLQVWRWHMSMALSILHRVTGVGLYAGMALLAWWLVAAAIGPDQFAIAQGFFASWFGRLVLFGFTWALVHHALGGLRHLVWDTGRGLDLDTVYWTGWAVVAGAIALTVVLWVIGYVVR